MANNNNQIYPVDEMNAYSPNSLTIFPDLLQLLDEEQLDQPANPAEITEEQPANPGMSEEDLVRFLIPLGDPRVRQRQERFVELAPAENRFMHNHLQHEPMQMIVDGNRLLLNHLPQPQQQIMAPLDGNRFLLNRSPLQQQMMAPLDGNGFLFNHQLPLQQQIMAPLDHENQFLYNHLRMQNEVMPLENPFLCSAQYMQEALLRSRHAGRRTPRPTVSMQPESTVSFIPMTSNNMFTRRPRTTRPRIPARLLRAQANRAEVHVIDPPPGFDFENPITDIDDVPIPGSPPREESPDPEARVNNTDCSICMSPFYQPTSTKCGHVFCWRCIKDALAEMRKCPICRTRITRRDLFRIYLS